ncbi:MAG: asparagine synthetase B [Candidatus Bathyarchaeia archaeon]
MAVVSKDGENAVPKAIRMLGMLKHRGSDLYGIATDKTTTYAKDIRDLNSLSRDSTSRVVLGYNFRRLLPEDIPQPVEVGDLKVILEGRIYSSSSGKGGVYEVIKRHGEESLRNAIINAEGDFIIAILSGQRLLIGRDVIGAAPLYFLNNNRLLAFASERKALWILNARDEDIMSFPPGSIAEATDKGIILKQIKALERTEAKLVKDEEALLGELHNLLLEAVKRRLNALEGKISVAFSGGLDSSIIAALIKGVHADAILVTVGLEGSKDLDDAEKVAGEIGLRVRTEIYTLRDIEETLPRVLWLIEEANALKASIKIPEYWAAEVSSKLSCRAVFFGQGGDELFGGYHKYLGEYRKSLESAEMALYLDTINLYRDSLEMSEKICAFHSIEARFPYMDYELAAFALKIPITIKISSADDPLRKRILRRYAEQIGLPADVYLKPKRAIQYGAGVSKALKKIAKRNGLSMQGLVGKVFREVKGAYENSSNLFF